MPSAGTNFLTTKLLLRDLLHPQLRRAGGSNDHSSGRSNT